MFVKRRAQSTNLNPLHVTVTMHHPQTPSTPTPSLLIDSTNAMATLRYAVA